MAGDDLVARFRIDATGAKQGAAEASKALSDIGQAAAGTAARTGSMFGEIRGLARFLGIGLAFRELVKNSEELQSAMEGIRRSIGTLGDQFAPAMRIIGAGLKESFDILSQGVGTVGQLSFVMRSAAVFAEFLRLGLIGIANGILLVRNVGTILFELLAGIVLAVSTGLTRATEFLLFALREATAGMVALFKFLGAKFDEFVVVPIANGIVKIAQGFLEFVHLLPESAQKSLLGDTAENTIIQLEQLRQGILKSAEGGKDFATNMHEARASLGGFNELITSFSAQGDLFSAAMKESFGKAFSFETLTEGIQAIDPAAAAKRITDAAMGIGDAFKKTSDTVSKETVKMGKSFDIGGQLAQGFAKVGAFAFEQLAATGKVSGKKLAGAILGTLGDLAIGMGTFLIAAGLGMEALKTLKGAQAIVAGAALIAIGGLLKGTASKLGGEAEAAEVAGPGLGSVAGPGSAIGGEPAGGPVTKQEPGVTVNFQVTGFSMVTKDEVEGVVQQHIAPALRKVFEENNVRVVPSGF